MPTPAILTLSNPEMAHLDCLISYTLLSEKANFFECYPEFSKWNEGIGITDYDGLLNHINKCIDEKTEDQLCEDCTCTCQNQCLGDLFEHPFYDALILQARLDKMNATGDDDDDDSSDPE